KRLHVGFLQALSTSFGIPARGLLEIERHIPAGSFSAVNGRLAEVEVAVNHNQRRIVNPGSGLIAMRQVAQLEGVLQELVDEALSGPRKDPGGNLRPEIRGDGSEHFGPLVLRVDGQAEDVKIPPTGITLVDPLE